MATNFAKGEVTVIMAASNSTYSAATVAASGDRRDDYDAVGAMKYIVIAITIYALLGILSLLLVRIIRRAKFRFKQHSGSKGHFQSPEEYTRIRQYLRQRPELQLQAHRQKLMHWKTKTAMCMWNTDIPSLSSPLLLAARPIRPAPQNGPCEKYASRHSTGDDESREQSSTPAARDHNGSNALPPCQVSGSDIKSLCQTSGSDVRSPYHPNGSSVGSL